MEKDSEEIVLATINESTLLNNEKSYWVDRDIQHELWHALDSQPDEWSIAPEDFAITPYISCYEIVLRPIEDSKVHYPDLLDIGEYVEPPMPSRDTEIEYPAIAQPLLTGRRVQIHIELPLVSIFDFKGNLLSGKIEVRDEEGNVEYVDVSSLFLALCRIEGMDVAIFDAVLRLDYKALAITDVLRWNDYAMQDAPAIARMLLLSSIGWPKNIGMISRAIIQSEEDGIPYEQTLLRPALQGYFDEAWAIKEGEGDE